MLPPSLMMPYVKYRYYHDVSYAVEGGILGGIIGYMTGNKKLMYAAAGGVAGAVAGSTILKKPFVECSKPDYVGNFTRR